MIEIDGSDGGGQMLRTAIALSTCTDRPFKMVNIRKTRPSPGLKNQHLECLNAMQKLSDCKIGDAFLGSETITFIPGKFKGGKKSIDIGTADSITLLMQSILLPSIFFKKRTKLEIIGGTDVSWSPSIDYFKEVLVPFLRPFANINVTVKKRGYYPAGQGIVEILIKPNSEEIKPIFDLTRKRKLLHVKGISHCSLDLEKAKVAERQARGVKMRLSKLPCNIAIHTEYCNTVSTGSGITLWAYSSDEPDVMEFPIVVGSDMLGEKGIHAEEIGKRCAENLMKFIESKGVIDIHLTDQILPFLSLNRGSKFLSEHITEHTINNALIIEKFLDLKIKITDNLISIE
jgi:RNA 3'-phosphate cyclase